MDELAVMIMSMDAIHLGGIGLAAVGSAGIMAYAMLRNKSSKSDVDEPTLVMNQPMEHTSLKLPDSLEHSSSWESTNLEENVNSIIPGTSLVVQNESSTLKLLETALTYDRNQNRDEVSNLIMEAIEQETNPKEKVRLDVIFKDYANQRGSLSDLITRYPSFLTSSTKDEPVDLFAVASHPVALGISDEQQAEIEKLAQQASEVDSQRATDDEDDTVKFLQEFGSLAQKIHDESKNDKKPTSSRIYDEPKIHDVWANYMSLGGGKMNLKNTFIHLEHAWGTISSIAELQEKINLEIGKDHHGNQIPWAVISVLPLRENS